MKQIFMLAIACALTGTVFAHFNNDDKKKKKKQSTEHCCKKDKCCKTETAKSQAVNI